MSDQPPPPPPAPDPAPKPPSRRFPGPRSARPSRPAPAKTPSLLARLPWKLIVLGLVAAVLAAPLARIELLLPGTASSYEVTKTAALDALAEPGLRWALPGYESLLLEWKRRRIFPAFVRAAGEDIGRLADARAFAAAGELPRLKEWLRGGEADRKRGAARVIFLLSKEAWLSADPELPGILAGLVGDPDYHVRVSSALTLARIGGPAQTEAFRRAAVDPDPRIRGVSAEGLARHVRAGALDLLGALLADTSQYCRAEAARALGEERPEGGEALLLAALEQLDHRGRSEAADGLGRLGSSKAIAALRKAWRESPEDRRLRLICVESLAETRQEEALAGLEEALGDPDREVRETAERALKKLRRK